MGRTEDEVRDEAKILLGFDEKSCRTLVTSVVSKAAALCALLEERIHMSTTCSCIIYNKFMYNSSK